MSELKVKIVGGRSLNGPVRIEGAKNSALPLLAAALAFGGKSRFFNFPNGLVDVENMKELLRRLGAEVVEEDEKVLLVDARHAESVPLSSQITSRLRASVLLMGALLGRFGKAKLGSPGGCRFQVRPIDIHITGLKRMGFSYAFEGEYHVLNRVKAKESVVLYMPLPSVTATENFLICASRYPGRVEVVNSALEPEVESVAEFLGSCGVDIWREGRTYRVVGDPAGRGLKKGVVEFEVIPDRVEAATYMLAGYITGGRVRVESIRLDHLQNFFSFLRSTGCRWKEGEDWVETGDWERRGVEVETAFYPGFSTDFQQLVTPLLCLARSASVVREKVYETRSSHLPQLAKMGGLFSLREFRFTREEYTYDGEIINVERRGEEFEVFPVEKLRGCEVEGPDLRGSGGLLLAGLAAEGVTVLKNASQLLRGYRDVCEKINALGGDCEIEEGEEGQNPQD